MSDATRVDALVASLRPALAEPLAAALAFTRTVVEPRKPADHGKEDALWGAALEKAGLAAPLEGTWARRNIPPASELSAEQRVVAEVLALTPGPYLMKYALPAAAWVRRQWLGIDPPGPLFRVTIEGVPLYHAVRAAVRRDEREAQKVLAALPPDVVTATLCDLRLASLDYWESHAETLLEKALPDRGVNAREWAIAFADRLLSLFAPGQPDAERGNMKTIPIDLARAAFVSLARAGVPIEPRWDAILPLQTWMSPEERARCVRAIPEERRDAAVATALARVSFTGARVGIALEILGGFALPSAAACLVANLDGARNTEEALGALRAVGAKHPAVAAIAKPLEAKLARAPRLHAGKRIRPITRKALDPTRSKQLEAANRKYGGKKMTADQIFDAPDDVAEIIMPRLTELVLLEDEKGKPAYDAWLYMGDSGTVFKAGTTSVIAEIVQGGLECKVLALELALKAALSDRPPPASTAAPKAKRAPARTKKR